MNERDEPREKLTTADVAGLPQRPRDERREVPSAGPGLADPEVCLLPPEEMNRLKSQWTEIQAEFVDEPRHSVEEADGLVAATIKRLAESFAEARQTLETQWARGDDVSTEDLRVALRKYRAFFDRLLAV